MHVEENILFPIQMFSAWSCDSQERGEESLPNEDLDSQKLKREANSKPTDAWEAKRSSNELLIKNFFEPWLSAECFDWTEACAFLAMNFFFKK